MYVGRVCDRNHKVDQFVDGLGSVESNPVSSAFISEIVLFDFILFQDTIVCSHRHSSK